MRYVIVMLGVLLWAAGAWAEPVMVVGLGVGAGEPGAVIEPLARRLEAAGAVGDLLVRGDTVWFVATTMPADMRRVVAPGRLRFASLVAKARPLDDVIRLKNADGTPSEPVNLGRAVEPRIVEAEAVPTRGGQWAVSARFDEQGKVRFGILTRALVGEKLAIVLDETVLSTPVVQEPITGGRVMVTLGADQTAADARLLAAQLLTRPLPGSLEARVVTAGTRDAVGGQTTVAGPGIAPPLGYATPKRWHPTVCTLVDKPVCAVTIVP